MDLRRAAMLTACTLAVIAGPAAAQAPWPAPQQSAAPWAGQQPQAAPAPFGPAQQQPAPAPFGPTPQHAAPAPFGPAPRQAAPAPFGPPPQQQAEQPSPCIQEFLKLRDQAQKRANAIRVAGENKKKKPTAQEACALFNAFSAAEQKMLAYATNNAKSCGIPPDVIANIKGGHTKTNEIRTRVCEAAARPQQPAAPSLSDALVTPTPDSRNIKSGGGGTFDTLSGTALGRQ